MASKFATRLYGNLEDLVAALDSDDCDNAELRAAIINVANRVRALEKAVEGIRAEVHQAANTAS